ncbi:hypothetical protein BT63DRAFT_449177 [Microthyrium microscopicum]|uniref:Uncharacterized protein n=1 Tax=Microthyrium microscopicum TaxID=703497 RepID=A0A6A6UR13_9PEZI|nr:hypothetical protein BT63DRAFT_449177 [Microthyrium microscopicum]
MTRRVVYGVGVWCTAAATAMTLAAIIMPRWVHLQSGLTGEITVSYGLHKKCSSVTGTCEPFPTDQVCTNDETFCTMWRTVGFLMSFSVIIELATFIAYAVVIIGGVQHRSYGWKVVCSLLGSASLVQAAGMAIIAYVFDHDERFFPGWKLDVSWALCTASWSVLALTGIGIGAATYALPDEGGYELIRGDDDDYGY